MQTSSKTRQAFTLVELAVVIGIIALLAAILIPSIYGAVGKAREARIGIEVAALGKAVERYKLDYGEYPPDFAASAVLPANGTLNAGSRANAALQIIDTHLSRTHRRRTRDFYRLSNGDFHVGLLESLNPQNALIFWLSGFTSDPQTPLAGNGERTPIFEFDKDRFLTSNDSAVPSSVPSAENVYWVAQLGGSFSTDTRSPAEAGPIVIDGNPSDSIDNRSIVGYYPSGDTQKAPYLYYRSDSYGVPDSFGTNASVVWATSFGWKNGDVLPAPYLSITSVTSAGNAEFAAADKYQIISAGRDGAYGGPGASDESANLDNMCSFAEGQNIEDFLDGKRPPTSN